MRQIFRLLLLPAAATLALAGVTTPAGASTRVVLDQGHVDVIGVAYVDGAFDVHVHDAVNDVEYAPSEVKFVAKPAAKTTVPADPAYRFLGPAGAPIWVLPQVQDPALLWPGIGAEEVAPGVFTDDSLQVEVVRVAGPGGFDIFGTDAFGSPAVLVDSGDGLPDQFAIDAGGHLHANWAFGAAGNYWVTVRVSGVLTATSERVTSAPATLSFKVEQ